MDLSAAWHQIRSIGNTLIAALPNLVIAAVVFALFFWGAAGIRSGIRRVTQNRSQGQNLGLVLGRLAQGIILLIGLLIALSIIFPAFKANDLIQLLGITSVAIGFAFRDIFQNFLAGIILLLSEPFRIGDQIIFGGFEGTVEDIQTRATFLRTYDGRRVVIPNSNLFTESVTVNTAFESRRCEYEVGIGYGDDIAEVKHLILDAMLTIEGVLSDPPPQVWVTALADSTVNLRVFWWINPPQKRHLFAVQDAVLMAIKNTLTENGIDLPFPTQQILFHDQTEETDGNRARQREGWPAGKKKPPQPRPIASILKLPAEQSSAPADPISGRSGKP